MVCEVKDTPPLASRPVVRTHTASSMATSTQQHAMDFTLKGQPGLGHGTPVAPGTTPRQQPRPHAQQYRAASSTSEGEQDRANPLNQQRKQPPDTARPVCENVLIVVLSHKAVDTFSML